MSNTYLLHLIVDKNGTRIKDSRDRSSLLVFDDKAKAQAWLESKKKEGTKYNDLKIMTYACSRSDGLPINKVNIKPFTQIINKNMNTEWINLDKINNIVLRYTKKENDVQWYIRFYKEKSYTDSQYFINKKNCLDYLDKVLDKNN